MAIAVAHAAAAMCRAGLRITTEHTRWSLQFAVLAAVANRRRILFHDKRHPLELGAGEVTAFLSHLAVKRNVAASTQNQASNAIYS